MVGCVWDGVWVFVGLEWYSGLGFFEVFELRRWGRERKIGVFFGWMVGFMFCVWWFLEKLL